MKNHIIPNLNESILKLSNKKDILINNYKELLELEKTKVITSDYVVEGEDLIVKKMDKYTIEISGKIKRIFSRYKLK